MYKRIVLLFTLMLIIGLLVPVIAAAGEFAKVGTVGTQFLKIPVGARGTAMGNAFAALSDDGTSMFWNPAGIVNVEKTFVSIERVNWLADIDYNAVMLAHRLRNEWAVGLFVTSLNSGDIEITTVDQPTGTGENFSTSDLLVGVSAATKLTDKFSCGANIKYVREDLDGEVADAWVVDIGTFYDTRWKTIKISMNIRNFGPEIELDGNYQDYDNGSRLSETSEFLPYHFPMVFKLGLAGVPLQTDMHRITVVGELEHPNDNIERYNIGGEYAFREMFMLRSGYSFNHDTMGLSAGFGVKWRNFGIDYAYNDFSILDSVHRFSLSFNF